MGKIWAVINLREDETAKEILAAMFSEEEFNPQSAILIQEKMVILEVFFEEIPPKRLPEAIGGYRDVRFGFGELSEESLKKGGLSPEQVYSKRNEGDAPHVEPSGGPEEQPSHDEGENEGRGTDTQPTDPPGGVEEQTSHNEGENEGGGTDTPPTDHPGGVEEQPPHDEGENEGGETDTPPTDPPSGAEDAPPTNAPKAVKGRNKPRKAPESIPQIDKIASKCTSYSQFVSRIAQWLELGKRESYFNDLAETAANVEKISWGPIEKELAKKGYNNLIVSRQRTSADITKKLAEMEIECSFIALVEYIAKYKNFDFRSAIESRVSVVLGRMGLPKEDLEIHRQINKIATEAAMAESDNVCIDDICKAVLGSEANDDDILDAKMNLSNFANQYLANIGREMMSAQEFINQFRKEIFMW